MIDRFMFFRFLQDASAMSTLEAARQAFDVRMAVLWAESAILISRRGKL